MLVQSRCFAIAFACFAIFTNFFPFFASAVLFIETVLDLIRESIGYDNEPEVKSLAQVNQDICLQLIPIALHWLNRLFILFFCVCDNLSFFVKTRKWVGVVDFFVLHPVVHLGTVVTGRVAK